METVLFSDLMNALADMMGVKDRITHNYVQFMLENGIIARLTKARSQAWIGGLDGLFDFCNFAMAYIVIAKLQKFNNI